MSTNQNNSGKEGAGKLPTVGTGNASNPTPGHDNIPQDNQLLDEKAGKYIREVASPEDYPDAVDEQEMNEDLRRAGDQDQ
jgi:hypothetical protein